MYNQQELSATSGQYSGYYYNYGNYQNYGYAAPVQPTSSSPVNNHYFNYNIQQYQSDGNYSTYQPQQNYSQYYNYNNNLDLDNSALNSSYDLSSYKQSVSQLSATSIDSSPTSIDSSKTTSSSSISATSLNMPCPKATNNQYKKTRATAHNQLPEEAVDILNDWFDSHINHPYPTTEDKHRLSEQCGITVKQVNSWFCNRRNRSQNTKPKRIKRQLEQEITNVYNELVLNPNKTQVIEKFRSALIQHDIGIKH